MDVQAVAQPVAAATFTLPPLAGGADPGYQPPDAASPAPPSGGSDNNGSAQSGLAPGIGAAPGLALLPPPSASTGDGGGQSLTSSVAKAYNIPDSSVAVSFQPAAGSSEIVTVFTDKKSGKVIVQFPSETLIALAQFFQKIDSSSADNGAVVDKKV